MNIKYVAIPLVFSISSMANAIVYKGDYIEMNVYKCDAHLLDRKIRHTEHYVDATCSFDSGQVVIDIGKPDPLKFDIAPLISNGTFKFWDPFNPLVWDVNIDLEHPITAGDTCPK
ncbi:hypothetical protein D5R81_13805 [Parashewanella spongiae]|uniref:Uncharacterized protein n=1 Tax=Parashewanella spongiae TaxID=342950 RepID=A0A3A6T8K8_9GAMM|nr:hypothetical protein [Parashewanella spongiae]MCL1078337.1 hypothetical protein [Parashewanella spongiae]RJY10937.1 hypothetical protein D5R81_13805 [Parashewanella spongiae]